MGHWINFYNHRHPHQALDMKTPAETFALAAQPTQIPLSQYTEAGGRTDAIVYTLIETVMLNAWLADTISASPAYKITRIDDFLLALE